MEALIVESFMHYYGLDWLAFLTGALGMYLLTCQSRYGFVLSSISSISGLIVAMLSLQFGFVVYNFLLIGLMIRGYLSWGIQPEAKPLTP